MAYANLSKAELQKVFDELSAEYKGYQAKNLSLNMARGKPSAKQLELALGVLEALKARSEFANSNGDDCRNYGLWDGLPEMKRIFADMVGVPASQVILGNNSSLMMMFEVISRGFSHGYNGCTPWCKLDKKKFLCPVPGYDRHFAVTEYYGFELINIPMYATGPDMDLIEKLVKDDDSIKGIWCVPKYSNPDGIVYSDETIARIAALKPAAPDFALMWDNAYCIHEFDGDFVPFPDILSECEMYGNADMVFEFASTSKVTLPGAGISCFACSEANMEYMCKLIGIQAISFDKMNQLRHVKFLQNKEHTLALMKEHAKILKPKFEMVVSTLEREIAPLGIATWHKPKGGYFVSVNTTPGLAKRTLALCKEAGVVMTSAGATYPYGHDPADSNIRVAPSLPPVEELEQAMAVFCCCLKLAALEKSKK